MCLKSEGPFELNLDSGFLRQGIIIPMFSTQKNPASPRHVRPRNRPKPSRPSHPPKGPPTSMNALRHEGTILLEHPVHISGKPAKHREANATRDASRRPPVSETDNSEGGAGSDAEATRLERHLRGYTKSKDPVKPGLLPP